MSDITIIPRTRYSHKLKEAESLIHHVKDARILAAVLHARPDYLLTGDSHFFTEEIRRRVRVMTAGNFLLELS